MFSKDSNEQNKTMITAGGYSTNQTITSGTIKHQNATSYNPLVCTVLDSVLYSVLYRCGVTGCWVTMTPGTPSSPPSPSPSWRSSPPGSRQSRPRSAASSISASQRRRSSHILKVGVTANIKSKLSNF